MTWIESLVATLSDVTEVAVSLEKAHLVKQSHQPDRVYRFRSVSPYALENLRTDTVWLSRPLVYNDPYDCGLTISYVDLARVTAKVSFDKLAKQNGIDRLLSAAELEDAKSDPDPMTAVVRNLLSKHSSFPGDHEKIIERIVENVSGLPQPQFEQIRSRIQESLRICSFSERRDSIIMWSHYAERHEGFCLEYETSCANDPTRLFLFPVIYSDVLFDATRYVIAAIDEAMPVNHLFPMLAALYKAEDWSYEREWRLVVPARLSGDCNWAMPRPTRVFLGAKIKPDARELILSVAHDKGIECRQMRLAHNSFAVIDEPV
jgi:hypothetical protein